MVNEFSRPPVTPLFEASCLLHKLGIFSLEDYQSSQDPFRYHRADKSLGICDAGEAGKAALSTSCHHS